MDFQVFSYITQLPVCGRRDRMVVGFTILLPITTNVVSSNHAHGEVYSLQHYEIKFFSDLRQVCNFHWVLHPLKLTATT